MAANYTNPLAPKRERERVEARIAAKEDGNEKSQLMKADFRNE